jgi:hypothetical protein
LIKDLSSISSTGLEQSATGPTAARNYLSVFAALFRARNLSFWQIVLSPRGVPGGYASLR